MKQVERDARGRAQKFRIQDAEEWMEWEGLSLADVVNEDETPGVKLGAMGFARVARGTTSSLGFPYDEVLVITKGKGTVTTPDKTVIPVAPGEVMYTAAGTNTLFHADEDLEMVYVASSPYGEHNRDLKAQYRAARGG